MSLHLDAVASFLNFVGGVLLAREAMRTRRAVRERRGTEILLDAIKRIDEEQPQSNEAAPIYDDEQTPLRTHEAIEDWFAKRSSKYAWIGFVFISLGFGLDLVAKLFFDPASCP